MASGEYSCDRNHAWHSLYRRRDRTPRMVVVSSDRVFSWLDVVVFYDSALAQMGSATWRASRQVAEVGGRCWLNLAQGFDLGEDRIPNRRITGFLRPGRIVTRWTGAAKSNDERGMMNDESRVQRSAFIIHTCISAPPAQLRRYAFFWLTQHHEKQNDSLHIGAIISAVFYFGHICLLRDGSCCGASPEAASASVPCERLFP